MTKQKAATVELARLTPFLGSWDTDGEIRESTTGHPTKYSATDTYEWLPGGYFLLHRFDANMPTGTVKGTEVIGYDEESKAYFMHSYDSTGNTGVMQARVDGDEWTFTGEGIRFRGGFLDHGRVFAGHWELRSDVGSDWQPWMDVNLKKADRTVPD